MECKTETYMLPGDCCPRCRGFNETGEDCNYLGRLLEDGDIIIYSDSCNKELKCYNGTLEVSHDSCTYMECETETYMLPGDCCPRCRGHDRKSCNVDGELFRHGEKWIPNLCASCECLGGNVICRVQRRCSNAWFYNNPTKRRRNTNPCVERNGGCDHYCEVENGRAKCYCHEGFHQDGRSCNRLHACQSGMEVVSTIAICRTTLLNVHVSKNTFFRRTENPVFTWNMQKVELKTKAYSSLLIHVEATDD
ncbi:kielin/chordin-like protein [Parasteatoda tepidariorum]|uniref:kielin/chordin-like protein n=1 Tax=Parasteatoda tepidariorum TaxID=114398 RepID=UPI0039BD7348